MKGENFFHSHNFIKLLSLMARDFETEHLPRELPTQFLSARQFMINAQFFFHEIRYGSLISYRVICLFVIVVVENVKMFQVMLWYCLLCTMNFALNCRWFSQQWIMSGSENMIFGTVQGEINKFCVCVVWFGRFQVKRWKQALVGEFTSFILLSVVTFCFWWVFINTEFFDIFQRFLRNFLASVLRTSSKTSKINEGIKTGAKWGEHFTPIFIPSLKNTLNFHENLLF